MTGHQIIQAAFVLNTVLMIVFPIWAFVRLRVLGILLSALLIWGLELLIHPAIAAYSPGGMWPFFWVMWLGMGWVFSLIYAAIITGITWLVIRVIDAIRKRPVSEEGAPEEPIPWGRRIRQWERRLYPVERIALVLMFIYVCALAIVAFSGP